MPTVKIVTFRISDLRRMPRPPEYLAEMHACATEATDITMTFDADAPCFVALQVKYRNLPLQNIPDDYDPETSPDSPKRGSCCDPPRA